MILAITLIGASIFLLSEIFKNKGHTNLSKIIFPITSGIGLLMVLWWITKIF